MKDELYTGHTESAEQIADRWQRIKAKSFACDVYGEELTDAEAAALRWALELAETEDEREAQAREAAAINDWLQGAVALAAALHMQDDPRTPAQRAADEDWQDEQNTREAVRPGY